MRYFRYEQYLEVCVDIDKIKTIKNNTENLHVVLLPTKRLHRHTVAVPGVDQAAYCCQSCCK